MSRDEKTDPTELSISDSDRDAKTTPSYKPPSISPLATSEDIAFAVDRLVRSINDVRADVKASDAKIDLLSERQCKQDRAVEALAAKTEKDREVAEKDRKSRNWLAAGLTFAGSVVAAAIIGGAAMYSTHDAKAAAMLSKCEEAGRQGALSVQPSTESISYEAARRGARDEHTAILREMPPPLTTKPDRVR
jgi:hypothetical protein